MVKKTIGFFEYKEKKHNIYIMRGYQYSRDWVYVGNYSFGTFLRFNLKKNEILIKPRNKIYKINILKRIKLPCSDDDIENILKKIFKRYKRLKLLNLDITSRKEIIKNLAIDEL